MPYITIADKQYFTKKETISLILNDNGFKVSFVPESISGRFRSGYFKAKVTHSFRCFADKLRASREVRKALEQLEVV